MATLLLRRGGRAVHTTLAAISLGAALALAACSGSEGATAPQAWIDAPLHESTHPVAPMEVVAHAADPGGVALVEISINDEVFSRRPPESTSTSLVTFRADWDPQAPGEYTLLVRAQNNAGVWSDASSTRVVVTEAEVITGPILVLTPTSAPLPQRPALPTRTAALAAACTDRAAFVTDVTIPDNTNLAAGSPFTKIWRLRNDGTCTWDEGYKLVFVDGTPMNNPTPLSIPNLVAPGGTIDLAVDLVAPTASGAHRGNYQIRGPQGVHFGVGASGLTPFYVQIVVSRPSGPAPTADSQAPSVGISHSPSGSSIPTTQVITFTATASDNVGVARIDIYVTAPGQFPGKVKTCTSANSCSYTGGPYPQGNLSYYAVARDAAGNESTSSVTTVVIYVVIS